MTQRKTPAQDASDIRVINYKLDDIKRDVTEIKTTIKSDYVTKDQFDPVKRLVYGVVSLILTAFVLAVSAYVLRTK